MYPGTTTNRRGRQGFTMVEVVVAAVIFALAAAGIFATISAMQQPAVESEEEIKAAFMAKRVLDEFRNNVDASLWSDPMWDPAGNPHTLGDVIIDGITYTPTYDVTDMPDGSKKVDVTISWTK